MTNHVEQGSYLAGSPNKPPGVISRGHSHILSTARHIQSGTAIAFKNVPQKQGSEKPVSYSVERPPFLT